MKGLYALVGMKHRGTLDLVANVLVDGEALLLIREPSNKFDPLAVQVWARGLHVGYIKATQARPLALAMDAMPGLVSFPQAGLKAAFRVKPDRWPMVEVA